VEIEASIHAPLLQRGEFVCWHSVLVRFFLVFSQVQQFSLSFQQLALKNVVAAVLQLFFPLTQDKGEKKSQLYSAAMPDGNNS